MMPPRVLASGPAGRKIFSLATCSKDNCFVVTGGRIFIHFIFKITEN